MKELPEISTEVQFKKRFKSLSHRQRLFVLAYVKCFDARQAAREAGYQGVMVAQADYRILRRVYNITDYIIAKSNAIHYLVSKQWILDQLKTLFDNSRSEVTKLNILDKLSKLLGMGQPDNQVNVAVQNNVSPVKIVFQEEKEK